MTTVCRTCGAVSQSSPLDLGTAACCVQPGSTATEARQRPRHPFRLRHCSACGTIELVDLPDLELLKPAGPALLYRDPERHLEDLARATAPLVTSPDALIVGMTYKDRPLLDRLRDQGLQNSYLMERDQDWSLASERDGIETIQQRWTIDRATALRRQIGPAGLLVVRHLLEHVHDLPEFLGACRQLTAPDGLVLFEVPGCETEFARGDAGTLWEEHVRYWTSTSLRVALAAHGFHANLVGNYPYTVEDCLVVVCRFGDPTRPGLGSAPGLLSEFQQARRRIAAGIAMIHADRGRIAVYGAGHRTSTWLELAQVQGRIECVIDDDPARQGRFLAGSGLEVGPAAWLRERQIRVCVPLLSREIVRKLASRETAFQEAGGQFLTLDDVAIYAGSDDE